MLHVVPPIPLNPHGHIKSGSYLIIATLWTSAGFFEWADGLQLAGRRSRISIFEYQQCNALELIQTWLLTMFDMIVTISSQTTDIHTETRLNRLLTLRDLGVAPRIDHPSILQQPRKLTDVGWTPTGFS